MTVEERGMKSCTRCGVGQHWRSAVQCRKCADAARRPVAMARAEARFWSFVDRTGECWLWRGDTTANGYGRFKTPERRWMAHRYAYDISGQTVPVGYQLDHLCHTRACVNPAHLEAVTPSQNARRNLRSERTHCPRGHAFTPENTRQHRANRWGRVCRRCGAENMARCRAGRIGRRAYLARDEWLKLTDHGPRAA